MKTLAIVALIGNLATSTLAGDKINLAGNDTAATLLTRQIGQKVELRMKSGDKLNGSVKTVLGGWVHLASLKGEEFYDAVVLMDDISAVIIRNDGK